MRLPLRRSARWLLPVVCVALVMGQVRARADDALAGSDEPTAIPLVLITFSSVEKALSDIGWMYDSIDRPDMKEVLASVLRDAAGDLEGFDRARPFGQVVFLDPSGLPPRPVFVGFAPVSNIQTALAIFEKTGMETRAVEGRNDLLELFQPGQDDVEGAEGDPPAYIRLQGNYAYFVPGNGVDIVDDMPDLEAIFRPLAARYDASLSVRIKAIPKGIRTVFLSFLRTQAEIELQRRDDEPEVQYLLRRANGVSGLEFIEQLLTEGEDFTLGLNARPERKSVVVEAVLNATPDSSFAEYLREVGGRASLFGPLHDANRPLTINVSWMQNEREKKAASTLLQALRLVLERELPALSATPEAPVGRLIESLQATVDNGHFDAFLQFAATPEKNFVITGGMRIVGGQSFAGALRTILDGLIVRGQELKSAGRGDFPVIRPARETYQDVVLHSLGAPEGTPENREARRFFGGHPELWIGASSRVLWFSLGHDDALPTLRETIDTLRNAPPAERSASNAPVHATFRMAPWLELPQQETNPPGGRRAVARELAEQAFRPADGIQFEGRPTESGFRMRVTFDEGFVRMLGLAIARQYDQSQL